MRKFHINDKGKVGECRAKPGNCRFKRSEEEHFPTPEKAQEYYEMQNKAKTLNNKISKTFPKEKIVKLDQILDKELLNKMIKEKYISRSFHPEDDSMQILFYSRTAMIDGKWNDATKQARGLIVQTSQDNYSDAIVLQRPWKKFFTLQQLNDGWHLGDEEKKGSGDIDVNTLDFNAPAEVTDKMDGSLGIFYQAPDGKIALTTKGGFHSGPAVMYTDFFRKNEKMYETMNKIMKENPNTTFLTEMVGPKNQIVLKYDKQDLSLLGAVDKETGKSFSPYDYKEWQNAGLTITEKMEAKNLSEALNLPNRENKEGMVVRMLNDDPNKQFQIKIKQDDYLKLHKIATHLSYSGMRANIRDSIEDINIEKIREIAEKGDVKTLPKINKELTLLKDNSLDTQFKEREKIYKDNLIPASQNFIKIYDEVQKIDSSLFTKKNAMREIIQTYKGPKEDKNTYIALVRNRFEGEQYSKKQMRGFLNKIVDKIKVN